MARIARGVLTARWNSGVLADVSAYCGNGGGGGGVCVCVRARVSVCEPSDVHPDFCAMCASQVLAYTATFHNRYQPSHKVVSLAVWRLWSRGSCYF